MNNEERSWLITILVSVLILSGFPGSRRSRRPNPRSLKVGVLLSFEWSRCQMGDMYKKALDIYAQIINERGIKIGKDTYRWN